MASSLMAAAAAAATVPERAQFACCELNSVSGTRGAPLLQFRIATRRVGGGRRSGGAIRASSSGTADENFIPESEPPSSSGSSYNSHVDANMMVLRRRIEGMRMKETFTKTPEEWMEWEKNSYGTYRANVNILAATLQSMLLVMRPGVVLFIISFLLAAAPVAVCLFLSAVGSQMYTLNNAVLDFLTPCAALPPLIQ